MGEQSGGPGWWLASDGNWYPPETAPAPVQPSVVATATENAPGLPQRVWRKYRAWPLWVQIVVGIVLLSVLAAPFTSDPEDEAALTTDDTAEETTTTERDETSTTEREETTTTDPPTTTTTAPPTTTTAPPPPTTVDRFANETVSQRNARQSGADYLDFTAFSRSGLIDQLEFEGFSTGDATYAVDALYVDWNEQAAKSAADYLDFTSFSRSGLIDQLVYEGFSQAQAEYGVNTTGL